MQGLLQISCALSVLALVKVFQHRPSPAPAANLFLPSPQVTVRFDTILTVNNRLREEIENLRIQKAILDNFYAKLRKHLDQQKNRMDAAVEQSTQAYEQRCAARAISVTGVRGKGDCYWQGVVYSIYPGHFLGWGHCPCLGTRGRSAVV